MSMTNVLSAEEMHQLSQQAQVEGGLMINLADNQVLEYGKLAVFEKNGFYFLVNKENIRVHNAKTFTVVANHQLNPNEYAVNNAIPVSRIHKIIDQIMKDETPNEMSQDEIDQSIRDILAHIGITNLNKPAKEEAK